MSTGRGVKFAAVVVDIREESRVAGKHRWQMALDQTEFCVGNVGALEAFAPSGVKLRVPVLEVVEDGGELWHVVEKPLAVGTRVTGQAEPAEV